VQHAAQGGDDHFFLHRESNQKPGHSPEKPKLDNGPAAAPENAVIAIPYRRVLPDGWPDFNVR
jgi:hypothetical protein